MSLHAGDLIHRVDIESPLIQRNQDTGESKTIWQPLYNDVPARVTPVSVKDFIASRAESSEITARIVIRHRTGLTAQVRIKHRGKIYNPQGWLADPDTGLEYLTAPCTEGLNQG